MQPVFVTARRRAACSFGNFPTECVPKSPHLALHADSTQPALISGELAEGNEERALSSLIIPWLLRAERDKAFFVFLCQEKSCEGDAIGAICC